MKKLNTLLICLFLSASIIAQPETKVEIIGDNTDSDGNTTDVVFGIKNNNYSRYRTTAYSNTWFRSAAVHGARARGTINNPESLLPRDRVFGVYSFLFNNGQFSPNPISSIEHFVGEALESGVITFSTLEPNETLREERLRIDEYGNIGIGTLSPKSKLQITNGDIFIEDINSGVIMRSPDGKCWRMTVNNLGLGEFSLITCPI